MKKPKFVLSRKNQKGQVAIFVALIFQVIFVFFALLINVGLLVHHKINLQQSTDLAAYYGAMKQAESLNAIAHVNYQIRQAWKLLTWRYRVVGTFGFQSSAPGIQFPLTLGTGPTDVGIINGGPSNGAGKCLIDGESLNTNDLPFFC
ncbi:MAG: Tad domain-containing protein, partial [Bdellovibrio sp.]|nr:Tad domain-containing protein [Bdellovibrio sp.]